MQTIKNRIILFILISFPFLLVKIWAQSLDSTNNINLTADSSKREIITFRKLFDLEKQMKSNRILERRLAYNYVASIDYIQQKALENYEKEDDPLNKRIISLIGHQLHPTSTKWNAQFLKNFPRTQEEISETFGFESYGGDNFDIGFSFIDSLGDMAYKDRKAIFILFGILDKLDGAGAEEGSGVIYKIANKSPRYFLGELKQRPKEDRDIILGHLAFGSDDDEFNGPFKKELELLIKKKDRELGDFAAYCLKYIEKSIEEMNKGE